MSYTLAIVYSSLMFKMQFAFSAIKLVSTLSELRGAGTLLVRTKVSITEIAMNVVPNNEV